MKSKSPTAIIVDGKLIADKKYQEIKKNADEVFRKIGRSPKLNVILASESDASNVYVAAKVKKGATVGVEVLLHRFSQDVSTSEIIDLIGKINMSSEDDGVIVQQPVFPNLDNEAILSVISPKKDVDGFTDTNIGMLARGVEPYFYPCTPKGIVELIEVTGIDITGTNVVVVGRSNIVGKPVAIMLLKRNATVTIAHSKSTDLISICQRADILISAVGKPKMIKGGWIKKDSIVIDVGINRIDGELCGDVDFEEAKMKAAYITPVPGGVGPMTVANLMENVVLSAMRKAGIAKDL